MCTDPLYFLFLLDSSSYQELISVLNERAEWGAWRGEDAQVGGVAEAKGSD